MTPTESCRDLLHTSFSWDDEARALELLARIEARTQAVLEAAA
jgi:hypothetical protein